MINKKLLAVVSLAAAVSTSAAFAKTEGNYAGVNLIRSATKSVYFDRSTTGSVKFEDNHKVGVGADYKYAINFDGVFIAPGAFAEYNGARAKDVDGDQVKTKYRYGLKADIGYDITDSFAIYFTNGLAATNYKTDWRYSGNGGKSSTELGYFYGAGLVYTLNKDLSINLEYNQQTVDYKTHDRTKKAETELSVANVGVSYHF